MGRGIPPAITLLFRIAVMAHAVKTAREIVTDAVLGRFDIPEFQRGLLIPWTSTWRK
jgi:hypothetical protein